jgi:transposase
VEGPPHGRKRHPVEAQDRGALARLARMLRLVADLLLKSFVRWRRDGTWDRLLARAQTKSDAVGEVEWEVSVDSTVVRAHQHAAGARRRPGREDAKRG